MMKKTAFVFPGQGSQSIGMSKGFFEASAKAREVFEEAGDALGFDVARLCFDGPKDELDRTENTQPALLTASVAALRALEERVRVTPAYFAGHSLGEYTALCAAGALSFKDAVRLVRLRGRFMQEAVHEGTGKMCAVLGLGIDEVSSICEGASAVGSVVKAANINGPEQVVISGDGVAVERAAGIAKARGAKRVIMLPVSVPSHSPLMEGAARRLSEELEKIRFSMPSAPVITNVEAEPLYDASSAPRLLSLQLTSPVRWVDTVHRLKQDGVGTVIEIGPGKVLTGLVRRIEKEIVIANLAEPADMEGVVGLLG